MVRAGDAVQRPQLRRFDMRSKLQSARCNGRTEATGAATRFSGKYRSKAEPFTSMNARSSLVLQHAPCQPCHCLPAPGAQPITATPCC